MILKWDQITSLYYRILYIREFSEVIIDRTS